jgi:hypothetical protein
LGIIHRIQMGKEQFFLPSCNLKVIDQMHQPWP